MNKESKEILEILYKTDVRPSDFIKQYRKYDCNINMAIDFFKKLHIQAANKKVLFKEKKPESASYEISVIENDLKEKRYGIINISESAYPLMLKEIYFPPPIIFFKGDFFHKHSNPCIAIVGTRKCSSYGRDVAAHFAQELSRLGITIVSGMASGIDTCSHKASVSEKGGTIAVMGCGIDVIYPQENRNLYSEIIEKGSVITEYLPGTPPLKNNFPARNRIISGLCYGVIIVEADDRSGALITADFALQQNREVFAVPGEIYSECSRGCHKLIKNGAKLTEDINDVLEELSNINRLVLKNKPLALTSNNDPVHCLQKTDKSSTLKLNNTQQHIYNAIGKKPVSIEEIMMKTGLNISTVLQVISELELFDLVKEKNLNQYCRLW
ncbi:MAG: hypothetical protein BWY60_00852 [Actinobacteria bacterium ADurb.Bin346]|nr:MAG: hypothetical protein BWY60_00852 [Actinobacteria bacterium ADurb.Bin346]